MKKLSMLLLSAVAIVGYTSVATATDNKVKICHTNDGSNYQSIVVSEHAIGGHFDNQQQPLNGHEDDLLLDVDEECPTNDIDDDTATSTDNTNDDDDTATSTDNTNDDTSTSTDPTDDDSADTATSTEETPKTPVPGSGGRGACLNCDTDRDAGEDKRESDESTADSKEDAENEPEQTTETTSLVEGKEPIQLPQYEQIRIVPTGAPQTGGGWSGTTPF